MILRAAIILLVSTNAFAAGLSRYSQLVVADARDARLKSDSVRITYLGTNGYRFEADGHSLLVDPYFSRVSLSRAAFTLAIEPDAGRINENSTSGEIDAILVTHGHFDHLLDVPVIMKKTGARLIASNTACELARRSGVAPDKCEAVVPGSNHTIGPWRITALAASHDRIPFSGVPFNGPLKKSGAPVRAGDWVCGEPLAFVIRVNGRKIFIDSGGTQKVLPANGLAPVDLAILGVALPDSRARFTEAVKRLQPRYILPSHQDNFFVPLSRGFEFGLMSDFPSVRRIYETQHLPGKLILLDYFRPWTLPPE